MTNKFVSVLKQVGLDAEKALAEIQKGEKVIEPVVEALVPGSVGVFGVADQVFSVVDLAEKDFALAGQASNGPAKLQAVDTAVGATIDAWIKAKLPASSKIVDAAGYLASRQSLISSIVGMTNAFSAPSEVTTTALSVEQVIAASAAASAATKTPVAA
jgi:hypothetical protein